MKRLFSASALLAILSVVTFLATRALVAQARRPVANTTPAASTRLMTQAEAEAFAAENPGRRETFSAAINPDEPDPVPRHTPGELYEASGSWKGLDVQIAGHDVQVMARAGIYESIPSLQYTWVLRLWTAGGGKERKLVNEVYYDHQSFQLTYERNVQNPEFTEHLTLEPGKYSIEVMLLSFPRGADRSKLRPGVDSPPGSGLGGHREITIAAE